MSDQPQPVRTGDVYPPSASAHDARRQRDEVLGTHGGDQQQNQDGDLRVTEAAEPHAGRRVVTATAGGQFTVPVRRPAWKAADAVTIGGSAGSGASVGGDRQWTSRSGGAICRGSATGSAASSAAWRRSAAGAETNMRPASRRRTGSG
ncbi:hypothetical protein ZWY2020_027843 [Hordeum vulgare]|nr:hypothetical protein ZWY2020_027843 [Hordeum vulgare]